MASVNLECKDNLEKTRADYLNALSLPKEYLPFLVEQDCFLLPFYADDKLSTLDKLLMHQLITPPSRVDYLVYRRALPLGLYHLTTCYGVYPLNNFLIEDHDLLDLIQEGISLGMNTFTGKRHAHYGLPVAALSLRIAPEEKSLKNFMRFSDHLPLFIFDYSREENSTELTFVYHREKISRGALGNDPLLITKADAYCAPVNSFSLERDYNSALETLSMSSLQEQLPQKQRIKTLPLFSSRFNHSTL